IRAGHVTGVQTCALPIYNLWDLEVALDVEWAHATAPLANIMLVATPTAETLGVQGFPDMMKAEQALIDSHQVDVISQSFGSGERSEERRVGKECRWRMGE